MAGPETSSGPDEEQDREWGFFDGQVLHDEDVFDPMSEEELAAWEDGPIEP